MTAEDRFAGVTDVELSDEGREQARRLAERLGTVKVAAVYASPLGRTMETASIIAQPHGLEVVKREGRYGRKIIDLPLDVEVLFLLRVADALELKANAFAIADTKDCVEYRDMRESVWVIERALLTILNDLMDQQECSSGAVPTLHSGPRG